MSDIYDDNPPAGLYPKLWITDPVELMFIPYTNCEVEPENHEQGDGEVVPTVREKLVEINVTLSWADIGVICIMCHNPYIFFSATQALQNIKFEGMRRFLCSHGISTSATEMGDFTHTRNRVRLSKLELLGKKIKYEPLKLPQDVTPRTFWAEERLLSPERLADWGFLMLDLAHLDDIIQTMERPPHTTSIWKQEDVEIIEDIWHLLHLTVTSWRKAREGYTVELHGTELPSALDFYPALLGHTEETIYEFRLESKSENPSA